MGHRTRDKIAKVVSGQVQEVHIGDDEGDVDEDNVEANDLKIRRSPWLVSNSVLINHNI